MVVVVAGGGGVRSRRQLSDVLASEGEDGIEARFGAVRGCWWSEDRGETLKVWVTRD